MSLSGWKTYLVSAAMVVLSGLQSQGYISEGLFATLLALLNGLGFAALRAGVAKS